MSTGCGQKKDGWLMETKKESDSKGFRRRENNLAGDGFWQSRVEVSAVANHWLWVTNGRSGRHVRRHCSPEDWSRMLPGESGSPADRTRSLSATAACLGNGRYRQTVSLNNNDYLISRMLCVSLDAGARQLHVCCKIKSLQLWEANVGSFQTLPFEA